MEQVIFTRRPWWSKVGAELIALPGGKIEPVDFLPLIARCFLTQDKYSDPEFVPDEQLIILAAEETVKGSFWKNLVQEAAVIAAARLIYNRKK